MVFTNHSVFNTVRCPPFSASEERSKDAFRSSSDSKRYPVATNEKYRHPRPPIVTTGAYSDTLATKSSEEVPEEGRKTVIEIPSVTPEKRRFVSFSIVSKSRGSGRKTRNVRKNSKTPGATGVSRYQERDRDASWEGTDMFRLYLISIRMHGALSKTSSPYPRFQADIPSRKVSKR